MMMLTAVHCDVVDRISGCCQIFLLLISVRVTRITSYNVCYTKLLRGCQISDSTAHQIDASVRKIIDDTFARTYAILETNREVLDRCAKVLLEKETLLEKELVELTGDLQKPARAAG